MYRTYACVDCSAPATSKRANAKYCTICRLIRNVTFVADKTKPCWGCNKRFTPIDRNDVLCGTCDESGARGDTGTCSLCKAQAQLYGKEVSVCLACMKDPEKRPLLFRALKKKQLARRAEHGHAEVAHA